MSEAQEYERNQSYRSESVSTEHGRNDLPDADAGHRAQNGREPIGRPLGSPLPVGAGRAAKGVGQPFRSASPGRALTGPTRNEAEPHSSAMQWAAGAIRQAIPFVQRLIPLIDGNIATAVANLLTPHHGASQSAPKVDLSHIETGLTELHMQQIDLREQLTEQNTSIKRVEDRLESVREATDRNTLEQQELFEDLKAVRKKVNMYALLLMGLLIISVLLNLALLLHILRVQP